jgi:hypothetical protein
MKSSLLFKKVIPFVFLYLLMIIMVITIDYLLHYFKIAWIGRQLGLAGTLVMVISFVYSLRKRNIIKTGSPKQLLLFHEYLAWIASVMLLVHAGIHFNAILPWLAVYMLLIAVASGFVGKHLLSRANDRLTERRNSLVQSGLTETEADRKLFLDAITVAAMQNWRVVHLPIAYLFGLLSLLHIITILMFCR